MTYPSTQRKTTKRLTEEFATLGRCLARGHRASIARAAWNAVRSEIIELCMKLVASECNSLSKGSHSSLLKNTDPQDLLSFSLSRFARELSVKAPTFHGLLVTALGEDTQQPIHHCKGPLCLAASITLRQRNARMSAFQYVLSLILWQSGLKKTLIDNYGNEVST